MIGRLLLTLAIGLGVPPLRAAAQGAPAAGPGVAGYIVAGYISAIDGRAGECAIQRGRKTLPARYWSDLMVGDRLLARDTCQMEIMPRDGPRRWLVMPSNSPSVMTDRARRTGPLPREVEAFGLALTQWNDEAQPPPDPPKRPPPKRRGAKPVVEPVVLKKPAPPPPLALPLLTEGGVTAGSLASGGPGGGGFAGTGLSAEAPPGGGRQRLVAMPRRFNLAWIGGRPPFTVTLKGPDGALVGFEIGEERIVSSMIVPRAGVHEVRIADAAGVTLRAAFEAVDTVPAIDQHDLASLPAGIARVVAATRLAGMDGGVWRLEAYARLAEEGRDNYAAALMAARLLSGKPLPGASPPPGVPLSPIATSSARDAVVR